MNASAIFHYNRSELYVFGVWILSSALITAPKKILWPKNRERIGASEVRLMQKQLTLLGYNTFGIDGKFGFNSKKALIDFQKDIKQTPDGHPDRSIFKDCFLNPHHKESRHFLSPSLRQETFPPSALYQTNQCFSGTMCVLCFLQLQTQSFLLSLLQKRPNCVHIHMTGCVWC